MHSEGISTLERLMLKALEVGKTPDEFISWAKAYQEARSFWQEVSVSPLRERIDRPTGRILLKGGTLPSDGAPVLFPPRVLEVVLLLQTNAGKPLAIEDIIECIPGMPATSVYPTISKAREILAKEGLPADEIIKTVSRRGTGLKAMYKWDPLYLIESSV